jgi:TRAP-type C4-dicarboxylate transport system permease small subunit
MLINQLNRGEIMKKKKLIAPIIITFIIVMYFIFYIYLITTSAEGLPLLIKIVGIAVPAGLAGVCIYVLIERIKEIRSDEEDDLSKY